MFRRTGGHLVRLSCRQEDKTEAQRQAQEEGISVSELARGLVDDIPEGEELSVYFQEQIWVRSELGKEYAYFKEVYRHTPGRLTAYGALRLTAPNFPLGGVPAIERPRPGRPSPRDFLPPMPPGDTVEERHENARAMADFFEGTLERMRSRAEQEPEEIVVEGLPVHPVAK